MVVGKVNRTKQWVTGQKIESFSDLEAGSSDEDDDSGSEAGSANGKGVKGRSGHAGDGDDDDADEGSTLDPANDWEAFEEHARRCIGTSKTSVRKQFLKDTLLPQLKRNTLTPQQVSIILKFLISTYPRYNDSRSRDAVLECVSTILANDLAPESPTKGKLAENLVKWLENEITTKVCSPKSTAAGSTIYSILCWVCAIFSSLVKSPTVATAEQPSSWSSLMRSLATSYEYLMDSTSAKRSVKKMGTVEVRRAFRNNYKLLPKIMQYLATTGDLKPPSIAAPLLGAAIDVALRLRPRKDQPEDFGPSMVVSAKDVILKYYRDNVIAARQVLPIHTLNAFNDFIGLALTPSDLATDSELVKSMDRALLRNPEFALPTLDCFFQSYTSPFTLSKQPVAQRSPPVDLIKAKLLPAMLSAAKSSNPLTRGSASLLLTTLAGPSLASAGGNDLAIHMVKEICMPVKTHKSASPDHRIALCQLLQSIFTASKGLPVEALSEASEAICASLGKEANEAALKASTEALTTIVANLLALGSVHLKTPASVLAKGMQDSKPNLRRIYAGAAGEILWRHAQTHQEPSGALADFVKPILPGFETALKNATASPVTSSPDGWIAVATIKGPLSSWHLADSLNKTSAAQSILSYGAKPSFLLSEKTHRKFTEADDEMWLVRSLQMVLQDPACMQEIGKEPVLQSALSTPLLHLATESAHYSSRQAAVQAAKSVGILFAEQRTVPSLFADGLVNTLVQAEKHDALQAAQSDDFYKPDRAPRLKAVIASIAQAGKASDDVLVELLVPCHHDFVGSSTIWVDAVISAAKDPAALAANYSESLLSKIWQYTEHEGILFRNAAYASLSTLAFVAPHAILPELQQRVLSGLNPSQLDFIGSTEIGIYNTPAGTTYVDVLSGADKSAAVAKGKNAAMDKWDQETRAALAAKKKASQGVTTLSKQEKLLVDAQLAKETEIRARVADALARVHQSLRVIRSLLSLSSDERDGFLPPMVFALLEAANGKNAALFAEEAFQTILKLYDTASSRISDIHLSLALSVLRSSRSVIVPADFAVEDLAALITRVLYRIRFQAEKEPFQASTFALIYPLLAQCIRLEGAGVAADDSDAVLEQLTLTIDVFTFHVKRYGSTSYPREQSISSLITALAKFPSLGRPISDALASIGEAMSANSTKAEQAALLAGLMVDESQVRQACLQALAPLDLTDMDYSNEVWIAVQDTDERNAQLALRIWDDNGLDVKEEILPQLLHSLGHSSAFVRSSTALAISEAVAQMPDAAAGAVKLLSEAYKVAAREKMPEYDQFGMLVEASLHQQDPWQERVAIAETFGHMASLFGPSEVTAFFRLLIDEQGLGDRSEAVRSKMLDAGIAVVDEAGRDNLQNLMDTFQAALETKSAGSEVQDRVTEAAIVLLGRLASFLDGSDPRMLSVIDRLLLALHTPSELVQDAVSECLPPLVKANREKGSKIIEQLLRETLHSKKYAERRGAAYGLAGAIKGRGVSAFKEFDVITRLSDAAEDKKDAEGREGAMFAFETMSAKLGRLFEPYIPKIVPLLLNCLGDSNPAVRQATSDAARVIMSKVSGHGVKIILPSLLDALEDRQWRTKKGAIELMGNMAYLAPRQLSISLPTIIPPLTEVLTDTHAQVRTSANASLKKFGDVVDNPEIKAMQSTLLGALVDPTNKTLKALNTLLTTSFVHYIDPSSLALIIPIIDRGLRERSSEMKRKGAQIVGNLASLTDSKDIIAYLPQLIPRMREVLVDPVPEARSTAAKSLGTLIERLGEDAFPTLVDDLVETLKSDMSGVDQQGAAQGLSEVLAGLGVERMENMLPEIINYTSSPRAYIREGFISLLIYLPSVFGDRFAPYLGRIIQPVLSGLADESEFVREASMRAGRMIVNNHSTKAIDLLLPELERGLFDQSWRIRLSSIQLVGELLFKLSGISGKAEFEDENAGEDEDAQPTNTEAARKMLDTLGKEKRDRVLASLYVLRQDSAGQVRLFSINVWKVLVANTPRTVREILPSLMQIIIRLLASPSEELREMVARTLAELCRKQGDRIMGDIIPILQQASKGSVSARQGCCLAFAEMLDATNKTQLEGHEDAIIQSVRSALVDEEPTVRQAAALAFDALQNQLGPRSIDQTIPTLLNALTAQGAASDAALSALQELMSVRAHAIFPILIPTLIAQPISAFNAQALASLVTVAGEALNRRLSQILDALQKSAESEQQDEVKEALEAAIRAVLGSVHDTDGLHMLMLHLLGLAKDPRPSKRAGGCNLFATFCQVTEEDFSSYHVDWLRQILSLFDDSDETVVEAAGRAMDAFTKTLTKEQMEGLSVALRRTIESLGSPGSEITGFGRPGGLKPVLPILIQGLLAGTNEQREQSAFALGDIVERTAVDSLKPYVTQITGPLIRIIAERYPAPVKAAILSTLTVLLTRVPQFVRPFFPQLQRTFVKNLSDMTSITVRSRAAAGLGVLMGLQPRIDPLITELVNNASHEEQEVRDAMVNALGAVVASGGANMSPPARDLVANLITQTLEEPSKEAYNAGVARTLAAMVLHNMPQAEPMLSTVLETKATQFSAVCLLTCLEIAPEQLYKIAPPSKVVGRILKNVISDAPGVARPAREARELLKKVAPWSEDEEIQSRLA